MEIADDAEDRTAQQEWNLLIHELSGSESDELNVEEHPDQTDNHHHLHLLHQALLC